MEPNEKQFTLINEDGTETLCEIIFTYYSDEFKKDYVIFNITGTDELCAAHYNATDGGEGKIEAVESDEEWDMLEDVVKHYFDEHADEYEDECDCDDCDCEECHCEDCDCDHEHEECDCDDHECHCGCHHHEN